MLVVASSLVVDVDVGVGVGVDVDVGSHTLKGSSW